MTRRLCLALCLGLVLGIPGLAVGQKPKQDPPLKIPDHVEVQRDVVYGKGGGRDLKLDLFLPKEGGGARPAIVFIHGGGWQGGNRRAFQRQAAYLAGKGYVGACIEYRLSGEATFPAAVEDCKCAVRWLRANARTHRLDPAKIAACGGSAGGHLAAMLGTTAGRRELEGHGGHGDHAGAVNLVIAFNGVFDLERAGRSPNANNSVGKFLGGTFQEKPDLYRQASPLAHASKEAPPFLFLHGTADKVVPIAQARTMLAKLRDLGVKAEIYEADGAEHGFFNRPPHFEPTLKRLEAFLDEHFRGK